MELSLYINKMRIKNKTIWKLRPGPLLLTCKQQKPPFALGLHPETHSTGAWLSLCPQQLAQFTLERSLFWPALSLGIRTPSPTICVPARRTSQHLSSKHWKWVLATSLLCDMSLMVSRTRADQSQVCADLAAQNMLCFTVREGKVRGKGKRDAEGTHRREKM